MAWGKGPPSTIEDFVRRLARDDPALTSLAILRFRRLDADDARALAAALATNTQLRELNASQHALPPQAYHTIARALASNPRSGVASLSLGTGELGDAGAVALVAGLLGRDDETAATTATDDEAATNTTTINTSLRHLDLEGRGLGEAAAAALAELLRWHGRLEHLDLGGNEGLGDGGAQALTGAASALATATPSSAAPLRRLSLHRCNLTHAGLAHLASAPFCATLAELSLAENQGLRGEEAGAALAALAAAAPRLRRLDARATALGDAGVAAAAAAGLLERMLTDGDEGEAAAAAEAAVLDLSSTALAAGGCEALAAALLAVQSNSRPRPRLALRLGHNRDIPPHAVARLASALGGMVDELDVGGAALDAAAVRALGAADGLRHLSLFSCTGLKEDQEAVTALCEALEGAAAAGGSPSSPSFASLEHLGLAACGLDAPALKRVLEGASSKGASRLRCLELGGNPGVQDALFEAAVNEARERRPSLDVAWRAGPDGADTGAAGGPGGAPPPLPPQLLQQQQQQQQQQKLPPAP